MNDSGMLKESSPKLGFGHPDFRTPVLHPNVYSVEQTTGPGRLLIGASVDHIEILLSLAETWRKNYYLLYVLLVPRLGKREAGRYQSPGPLSFDQIAKFCRHFAPFFQGDGRHHFWIGSTDNSGLLIYDQHNWIYAYGDLEAYTRVLQSRGFTVGKIELPVPHSHGFNAEFDSAEDELAAYCNWTYFPLQPDDDY